MTQTRPSATLVNGTKKEQLLKERLLSLSTFVKHRDNDLSTSMVRKLGSWHEQYAPLFRDYLRLHTHDQRAYEAVKRKLAVRYPHDRYAYTDAKSDIFWETIRRADLWAAETGWKPGASDA